MSYNANISNFLSIAQKQMLANFKSINNSWLIDHVALTAIENVGKHESLTFATQSGDPLTSSSQVALYNKFVTGVPQLFFRPDSNGTPIQLTNSNLNTVQTGALGGSQSSFLAGPFTIYMGYIINVPASLLVTLTPSSTLIYVGLSTVKFNTSPLTTQDNNVAVATNISTNQFTIVRNPTTLVNPTVYYMAIGK